MKRIPKYSIHLASLLIIFFMSLMVQTMNPPKFNKADVNIYFCRVDDCGGIINELLMNSNKSVHCAFYALSDGDILETLNGKNKKIEVKVVVDKGENQDAQFIKAAESNGIMHNKFCIIDGAEVMTGSYNPTKNHDENNIVIIKSAALAQNYEDEFQELWNREEGKKTETPVLKLGNITFESYFCPEDSCAERINEKLIAANSSIYFMAYTFTHPELATTLVLRSKQNISVRGIMEKSQNSEYSKYALFSYQGIDVIWDNKPWLMHDKIFIIDNETVITGSFNPTKSADEDNDENVLIIHDKAIAKLFLKEFERVREK
jgi:phosphatidylserine/phosphatidylglycerophosphate/cardiolipin synthase-like enzyme